MTIPSPASTSTRASYLCGKLPAGAFVVRFLVPMAKVCCCAGQREQ